MSFSGFPKEGLRFLADLADNNNREWFNAHKQDYIDYLLMPAQAFVAELGERLRKLSKGMQYDLRTNGSGSILRIYRDIRFSKDKSPYHTYMRARFWEGESKKSSSGYFFRFDANGARMHAGLHIFEKPLLAAYRDAVADKKLGKELEKALALVVKAGRYEVGGEHYKRVPKGYDPEHERANLLRYNGLYASSPQISRTKLTSSKFVDICVEHCKNMMPLHKWLVKVV